MLKRSRSFPESCGAVCVVGSLGVGGEGSTGGDDSEWDACRAAVVLVGGCDKVDDWCA